MDDQATAGLLALSAGVIIISLIWAIAAYLLTAFALNTMAKRQGAEDAFLAFIPIVQLKVWGDLVEQKLPDFLKPQAGWKTVWIVVGCIILNLIPIINILAYIVSIVFGIWLMYLLLERYGSNAVLFTILHIITCSVFFPLHVFLIRKNEPHY